MVPSNTDHTDGFTDKELKPLEEITDDELSGPRVDRRTTLSILSAVGAITLAGCSGGGGGEGTATTAATKDTATPSQDTATPSQDTATPSQQQTSDRYGGTLKAAWNTGAVKKLDPRRISTGRETQVAGNLFNGLVETTPKLDVKPDFAKDWSVEDKTLWTFNLREGVMYHEGYGEATAQDLEFYIRSIFNKPARVQGKMSPLKPLDEGGVRVVDDYTFQLETSKPYAPILVFVARGDGRGCAPIPPQAVKDKGRQKFLTHPVGSGPYKIAKHDVNSQVVLERFDDYWGTDADGNQLPYLDKIVINPLPEAATIINAIKGGEVQFADTIPQQNLSQARQVPDFEVKHTVGSWNGLAMQCSREPFTDPEVRLGFAKLIDQEAFVEQALLGNGQPALGPISPIFGWAYREDKPTYQEFAPEEGKQILQEKGVFDQEYTITVQTASIRRGKVLQQQLSNQGVSVKLESLPTTQFWERMHETPPDFDFSVMGDAADLDPDASIYQQFGPPRGKGEFNDTMFADEKRANPKEMKAVNLLQQARETVDRDKRATLYHQAEDIIMETAPYAFTHFALNYVGHSKQLKGYNLHPVNRDLFNVWLAE